MQNFEDAYGFPAVYFAAASWTELELSCCPYNESVVSIRFTAQLNDFLCNGMLHDIVLVYLGGRNHECKIV